MHCCMKNIIFFIFYILQSTSQEIIIPNQEKVITVDVSQKDLEISWRLNLPTGSTLEFFVIYMKVETTNVPIASKNPPNQMSLLQSNLMPNSYSRRLILKGDSIVLKSLDFEYDQNRSFFSSVQYEYDGKSFVVLSSEIMLSIIYPPAFIQWKTVTNILEKTDGYVDCLVASYPELAKLEWEVVNVTFRYGIEHPTVTDEIKKKYGIDLNSKLSYKLARLYYTNVERGLPTSMKCVAMLIDGTIKPVKTIVDILYPLNPPENLETTTITDNEAVLHWSRPSLDSGNPGDVITYKIELKKDDSPIGYRDPVPVNGGNSFTVIMSTESDSEWEEKNTTDESVTVYNLEPNSRYLIRVRAYNGATFSEPSREIAFQTQIPVHAPYVKRMVNQTILTVIIVCAAIFSFFLMIFSILCYSKVKKRRSREWAVLKKPKGSDFPDFHNINLPPEYNEMNNDFKTDGFASLPPPQIHPNFLMNYQMTSDYPNYNLESISTKNLNFDDNNRQENLRDNNSQVQTQIAARYISPMLPSNQNRKPSPKENRSMHTTTSTYSGISNKTAYV